MNAKELRVVLLGKTVSHHTQWGLLYILGLLQEVKILERGPDS